MTNENSIAPSSKSTPGPHTIDVVIILLLGVLLHLPFLPTTGDDAYITFRYARNLISGLGYVYNAGEQVLGTTTPLYTLYLALIGRLGLDFILVGKLTNIVADTAAVVILFLVVARATNRIVAWVLAILLLSSPYNLQFSASGMETGIYTFLVMLVLYLYEQRRWKWMALAGGVLVLVRPDGLLVLIVVALFWLMDGRNLKDGAKYAFLAVLVTLPWLIFATWYFGSPVPHSITAKALTYRSPVNMEWFRVLWYIFAQRGGTGGSILILALLGTGIAAVLSRQALRPLRIYLAWMVLYIATFTFVQSGRFGWYYAPIMPVLFTFVVLGGAVWFEQTRRLSAMTRILQSNMRYVLAGTLFLVLVVTSGFSVYSSWQVNHREASFERQIWQPLGRWIRENTTRDASVALESIGGIGWYSERYIWDEGGLVSAKTYTLNQETPGGLNVLALLQAYHPDLFITWHPWELKTLDTPEAQAWFDANYEFVERYTADSITWDLFRSRSSEKVREIPLSD